MYIALQKLGSVYKTALGVSNICFYGSSLSLFLFLHSVAIVMSAKPVLKELAKSISIDVQGKSFKELCHDENIKKAFVVELLEQAKDSGLHKKN